jgi:hypothetical protein
MASARQLLSLERRALLFRSMLPRRYWFRAVLALSQAHATVARLAGAQECARYESSCVDRWLQVLTPHGSFPVEYRVEGAEHLVRTATDEAGILCCTVHVPLTSVMMRACVDLGAAPDYVIAAPINIDRNGRWLPAGLREGFKAIPPGSGTLRRARTVLKEGGRFTSMLDEAVGFPLRPALMQVAGSVRARVVLCWAEMDASRTIVVTFRTAPHAIPDTEEKVWANLAALDQPRQRILASLQGQYWGLDAAHDRTRPLSPPSPAASEKSNGKVVEFRGQSFVDRRTRRLHETPSQRLP